MESGEGERVGGVGMALVVVEGAPVVALDGPGISGHGAIVVGDEIAGGGAGPGLGEIGVLGRPPDSGHFLDRERDLR